MNLPSYPIGRATNLLQLHNCSNDNLFIRVCQLVIKMPLSMQQFFETKG